MAEDKDLKLIVLDGVDTTDMNELAKEKVKRKN